MDFKDAVSVAAALLSIASLIYTWVTRSGKEAKEDVRQLELKLEASTKLAEERLALAVKDRDGKIDALEDRVSRVEGELKGVPDRESVHKMQLEMVAMRGSIDVMNERLVPLGAISKRLQDFLLEQANK